MGVVAGFAVAIIIGGIVQKIAQVALWILNDRRRS